MKLPHVLFLCAALVAVAAVSALPGRSSAGAADVALVAVDLDPAGNTATSIGTVQSARSVAVGAAIDVDVVVDSIPAPGLIGISGEVNYPPQTVRITAKNVAVGHVLQYSNPGASPMDFSTLLPDSDGSWRFDLLDLSGSDETGDGRILTFTVECLANGTAPIGLTDEFVGGGDHIGLVNSLPQGIYTVGTEMEATISCGTGGGATATPSPTPSPTATPSPSPSPTATPSPSPSPTPSLTPTASPTSSPTATPTQMPSPTPAPSSATDSPTPSASAVPSASASPSPTPTPTPTPAPTSTGSASPAPSLTPTPTPLLGGPTTPALSPTPSETPEPTQTAGPGTPTPAQSSSPQPVWGDLDCSGSITAADVTLALLLAAGLREGAPCSDLGDLDCGNGVGAMEALALIKFLAQISPGVSLCHPAGSAATL